MIFEDCPLNLKFYIYSPMSKLVIEAGNTEKQYWKDLWLYRELFYFLAWRDILVRYKQTIIGIAWAVLRPLLTMGVFVLVRGVAFPEQADDAVHPALVIFVAQTPWFFFATALSESSNSLVVNSNLVSKVYFPRLVVPASAVITSLVDFAISLLLLAGLLAILSFTPSANIVFLPLFTVLAFLAALGPGLLFTALNVRYRDFRYIVPFVVQIGFFGCPIFYKISEFLESEMIQNTLGEHALLIYSLNPMVGVINGFRWAVLGDVELYLPSIYMSIGVTLLFLFIGVKYFRSTERNFADVI